MLTLRRLISDCKHFINTKNFEEVYKYMQEMGIMYRNEGKFTELLYKLGIDPLENMSYVPDHFAAHSSITRVVIPENVQIINKDSIKI